MRIKQEHIEFIKKSVMKYLPDASVYLFGSRVYDTLKGGDIDILVIANNVLNAQEKRDIKIAYYKKFGLRKIDIVSFKEEDPSTFKKLTLLEAERL